MPPVTSEPQPVETKRLEYKELLALYRAAYLPPSEEKASLAERFLLPPFTVLDARQGYWQSRKRAWLDIGIQSELGRGGTEGLGGAVPGEGGATAIYRQGPGFKYATPGGSQLPAASLKDGKTQRGDGRDRPLTAAPGGSPLPLVKGKDGYEKRDGPRNTRANAQPSGGGGGGWKEMNDKMAETRTKRMAKAFNIGMNANAENGWQLEDNQGSGTSIFDPVICELAYRWFTPVGGKVLDPFAGGSVRGIVASRLQRDYTGIDLREEQIAANVEQGQKLCPDGTLRWICGDSTDVATLAPGEYDFVFSCPPYADLERYSDDPRDISTMDYADFLEVYRTIIRESCAMLADNRFACFVVGDLRDKRGMYRGFVADTIAAFRDAGLELYNDAVLVTSVGSLPIRVGKQFTASRKFGKALRNGTMVLGPTGWSPIEALQVGDKVIAGNGDVTDVTGVFPQGVRSLWTVTFNDGTSVDADTDHLWEVSDRNNFAATMTTGQILKKYGAVPRDPRPQIPMCGAVSFPSVDVPLDPYLLGLLLGDGGLSRTTPVMTTADEDILVEVVKRLPPGMQLKYRGYDYRLVGEGSRSLRNPLTVILRDLGLMGKLSNEKFVPKQYMWNDAATRLLVLKGLMDTDGTVSSGTRGATEFSTVSSMLADDVAFLARSLGAKVVMATKEPAKYVYKGEVRYGQQSYRVRISGGPCPFMMERKVKSWATSSAKREMSKRIVSIKPAVDGMATCISVAHPSSLYVIDSFTVTHNTHQNVLVFVKGDPIKATEACGTVDMSDVELPPVQGPTRVALVADDLEGLDVSDIVEGRILEDDEIMASGLVVLDGALTEACLACDTARCRARANGVTVRVWTTATGRWEQVPGNIDLLYLVGDNVYLNQAVFPAASTPKAAPPKVTVLGRKL